MSADRPTILELIAECRADLDALERAAAEIATLRSRAAEPPEGSPEVILYGYHLHQWYGAAEGLLARIAKHFGNAVDRTEWHRSLVERFLPFLAGLADEA